MTSQSSWKSIHCTNQTAFLFKKKGNSNWALVGPTVGSILLITSWSIWMSFSSKHFCISCNSERTWSAQRLWEDGEGRGEGGVCAKSSWRTYRRQRLIDLDRIEPPGAQALLPLLLLVLFHGLLNANLGSAPDSLFKGLQLVVEGVLVLLICRLGGDTVFFIPQTALVAALLVRDCIPLAP